MVVWRLKRKEGGFLGENNTQKYRKESQVTARSREASNL